MGMKLAAVVTCLSMTAQALDYAPVVYDDPFKNAKVRYVQYNVTDPGTTSFFEKLRPDDCASSYALKLTALTIKEGDTEPRNSLVLDVYQNIPDGYEIRVKRIDLMEQGGETIFLIDGKPTHSTKVDFVSTQNTRGQCVSTTGVMNYTRYITRVSFVPPVTPNDLLYAQEMKFRIYTTDAGYTVTIPQDVRANFVKLFGSLYDSEEK